MGLIIFTVRMDWGVLPTSPIYQKILSSLILMMLLECQATLVQWKIHISLQEENMSKKQVYFTTELGIITQKLDDS